MYTRRYRAALVLAFLFASGTPALSQSDATIRRAALAESSQVLERRQQSGSFFLVAGRRAGFFGYEGRSFESWVYPLKIAEDFRLSFALEGYPLEIPASDIAVTIAARPEATVLTYAHAAFTVRQILFAPIDEPGAVMLLDVDTRLPMRITGSFKPRLRLFWPAGLMTPNVEWDSREHAYFITEETRRFVGVIGSPGATELSLQPYQEEPRDEPTRFVVRGTPEEFAAGFVPVVFAASVEGRDPARASYRKILAAPLELLAQARAHYERLARETVRIETPDPRLDEAFAWAKVGIDKSVATNPFLGTGLVAGFRTSGESERPGFAWYFGRDALWTALATTSEGDWATTKTALEFLERFQRADGRIPHEISQSAPLVDWFEKYGYGWASADATPLFVIAHADYWRASGDDAFLRAHWPAISRAYAWSAATDPDGNGLLNNTKVGHGWVEGGALYPPHEEIYMQGLWVEASRAVAEMATAAGDAALAAAATQAAERTRSATERTYWLADRGFYAYATNLPGREVPTAEPGPNRARRQTRIDELTRQPIFDEDTILPAVPLWWRVLDRDRAQSTIDHLGDASIATDWGSRIVSNRSKVYDPLAYHYGSVWPLFTGWVAVGSYRYGRPHVGYQATMANALLTSANALGYVTELLSGDFNTPFGRSSHVQAWSEAMVVTPVLRGLFGLEARDRGKTIEIAPSMPADWNRAAVRGFAAGARRVDVEMRRASGALEIQVSPAAGDAPSGVTRLDLAPSLPLDARIVEVRADGKPLTFEVDRIGDVQRVRAAAELSARPDSNRP
jgi:glycogen debranching enzyme